jgi:hypothetical protein
MLRCSLCKEYIHTSCLDNPDAEERKDYVCERCAFQDQAAIQLDSSIPEGLDVEE